MMALTNKPPQKPEEKFNFVESESFVGNYDNKTPTSKKKPSFPRIRSGSYSIDEDKNTSVGSNKSTDEKLLNLSVESVPGIEHEKKRRVRLMSFVLNNDESLDEAIKKQDNSAAVKSGTAKESKESEPADPARRSSSPRRKWKRTTPVPSIDGGRD